MKVSIIVPIYNSEDFLDRCLDSLVNQTYENIEIILINDGSTDGSIDIINFYKNKYKNIKVISDTNHGQGYARNRGIEESSGELITFVDSDDYIDLNMVERLVNALKDSDIAVCNITKVIDSKKIPFENYLKLGSNQVNFMLSHPGPVAKLYRREVIGKIRFLDDLYYEDLLFTIQIAKKVKKVSFIQDQLYYYIIHNSSIMHKKEFNKKFNDIFTILDKVSEELVDFKEENEFLHIEHLYYSATLRYINFDAKDELRRISEIMKKFPNFKSNPYFKKKSFKFRLISVLSSKKYYLLLKILNKFREG